MLKMLPFDNKSEFQLVVEMPAGTPVEDTAAALHEMGGFLAQQPEVLDMQGYAGTASPITFNGLVRQYYLRADAEQGDLQINLVDKQHRHEQSHAIAQRLRPALEKIAQRHGARIKVVEVPPGPPVMSPLVAEIYGPSEAGRQALAARVAKAFDDTPDIVGIDTTLREDAPRAFLRVQRQRAESLGIPVAGMAANRAGRPVGHGRGLPARRPQQVPGAGAPATATRSAGGAGRAAGPAPARRQRPTGAPVRTGARGARRDRQAPVHQGPACP